MKIFLIVGKSFSGKDYLLNKILEDKDFCNKIKLKRLVQYTTRMPRLGETDGYDYNFITKNDFENNYMKDRNVIYTTYKTEYGLLHYLIDKRKLDENYNYIGVSNIETIEKMKYNKAFRDCINVIYLVTPNYILFKRFSERKENILYDENLKYKEIYRRFIEELIKYGEVSNRFLAGVRSFINVGKDIPINTLERIIESWCKKDTSESIIMDDDNSYYFDYKYKSEIVQDIQETLDGDINIANGLITIHTEEENFSINENNKIE